MSGLFDFRTSVAGSFPVRVSGESESRERWRASDGELVLLKAGS